MKNTCTDKNGYERFKDSNKLVHRWAATRKLNRSLNRGEVVHHKDRNKRNNSFNNLWVFRNQREHDKIHKYDANKHGMYASYRGFKKLKSSGCLVMIIFILSFILFVSFIVIK